jgi:Raf kinase inhibitor-like YbhB/YbcL family protein
LSGDPDAPSGSWYHLGAYDIIADTAALAPSVSGGAEEAGFKQAINDFQRPGYGGPCPPRGHPPHHHHFRLLALSADRLSFRRNPACLDVEREARKHALAGAVLVGLQQR